MKYGIDLIKLTKDQLEGLVRLRCEPAFHALALMHLRKTAAGRVSMNKIIKKYNFSQIESTIDLQKAAGRLALLSKNIDNYPLRALVNPNNKIQLNAKLSLLNTKSIGSVKFNMRQGNPFYIRIGAKKIDFTKNNINQMRVSIAFLNWNIVNSSYRKKNHSSSLCLSPKALELLVEKGIQELIKKAKKSDQAKLSNYLTGADVLKNMSYFRNISLDLSHYVNRISEEKLRRMTQSFFTISAYKWPTKFSRMPSHALYSDTFMTEQKYIWELYKIGYSHIPHLAFLKAYNHSLLRESELAKLLYKNFSSY